MPLKKPRANTMASRRRVPLTSTYTPRRMTHFEFFLMVVFLFSVLATFLAFTLVIPVVILALDPSSLSLQEVGLS